MVIIAGGGPAGSLYAYLMARKGYSVIVYDPGLSRRCGEAVPHPSRLWGEKLYMAWSGILNRYLLGHRVATIRSVANVWTRGGILRHHVSRGLFGYVIDKRSAVEDILSRAESEGAAVVRKRINPTNIYVDVVACSGCASAYRRPWRSAVVYQAYVEKAPILDILGVDAAIVFSPLIRGAGYAWAWPGSRGYNVGVGWVGWRPSIGEAREILYKLKLSNGGVVDDGFSVLQWYKPLRHWSARTRYGWKRFLGEAAGLVTSMAEGIRPAMLSAVAAAYEDRELWRMLVWLASWARRRSAFMVAKLMNRSRMVWDRFARSAVGREHLYATRPPGVSELLRMLVFPH